MRIDVLTLFPEMFQSVLSSSILKRAADPSLYPGGSPPVSYHLTNIRDYSTDKHKKVDRPPFGGGPGMVMQCEPVWAAVRDVEEKGAATGIRHPASAEAAGPTRILMTPQGRRLDQALVEALAKSPWLLVIAGHYEGIDERVVERLAPIVEVSIGDYVLSGGELAAMVLIDAVVRLVPGVLGDETSAHHESFSSGAGGMLDYPHYTRPAEWEGMAVPPVLLSGDHAKIEEWRLAEAKKRTAKRRPDLIKGNPPNPPANK